MLDIKKELDRTEGQNQVFFVFTSFCLHLFLVLILFHLPIYSHQSSAPKIIEVKIMEEKQTIQEISNSPFPLLIKEKVEKVKKEKIKKIEPSMEKIAEKIAPAPNNLQPQTEKVVLENFRMGPITEYTQISEDNTWLSDKLIFPEQKMDMKMEKEPQLGGHPNSTPASNPISGQGNIPEKTASNLSLPEGGWGGGKTTVTTRPGVWFEENEGGKRQISMPQGGSGVDGSFDLGQSAGQGNSKISTPRGSGKSNLSTFLGMARRKIEEAKRYPLEALRRNWEGKVILSFLVDQKGEIKEIKIIQSSGYKVLDEEAKATLQRASPLPIPPHMEEDGLKIEIPILFRIE